MVGERTNVTGSAKFAELDQEGRLRRGRRGRPSIRCAAARNVLDVNMDEGMLDGEAAMTTFLNLIADRARDRARPVHDRQLEVERHRGGPEVRPGQGHRQLDQPEGRRGATSSRRPSSSGATARASSSWPSTRRAGRHGRSQGRDLPGAPTTCSRRGSASPPSDIIFDPNILAIATGIEEHADYAKEYIEATRDIKATLPGREDLRRRVATSRSRSAATTSSARRCTRRSSSTPSAPAWTWASSTPGRSSSTKTSPRSCSSTSRTSSSTAGPTPPSVW